MVDDQSVYQNLPRKVMQIGWVEQLNLTISYYPPAIYLGNLFTTSNVNIFYNLYFITNK